MHPGDWYYLPQRKSLSALYLPTVKHIPEDSLLRVVGFSFPNLAPLATAYQSVQVTPAFNAWAIVHHHQLVGGNPTPDLGFQIQIWHLTTGGQRQFYNTPVVSANIAGTAALPFFLTETELFLTGDSIRVQVNNLSTTAIDNIWLALWGGDVSL
jgi:hypothetical protein